MEAVISLFTGDLVAPPLCPACEIEAKRQQDLAIQAARQREKQDRAKRIEDLLAGAGVPPRYRRCSLENYQGPLPAERPVMLLGGPGTGKTHLAVAYLRQWIINFGAVGAWFCRVLDLMRRLRQGSDSEDLISRYGRELLFLVLDDLGAELATDFAVQAIYDLVDLRYAYNLPLIITSNLDIREIGGIYGTHFLSRLQEMGEVVELGGSDRRLEAIEARRRRREEGPVH